MGLARTSVFDNIDHISKDTSDSHDAKGAIDKENPLYKEMFKENPNIDKKELGNPNSEIGNNMTDLIAQKLRKKRKKNLE
ncbi:hypothetical protein KBB25_01310 [Candidatus Gracilibacteria bacterium]|nr:hypothetical protein [Candidatus Gracilibacteria bacterium]